MSIAYVFTFHFAHVWKPIFRANLFFLRFKMVLIVAAQALHKQSDKDCFNDQSFKLNFKVMALARFFRREQDLRELGFRYG